MAAESTEPSDRDEFDLWCEEVEKSLMKLDLDFEPYFPNTAPLTELRDTEKMILIDRLNFFLECTTNLIFFGKFKPTSPWKF